MIASRTLIQQQVPGDAKARSRWSRMHAASGKFYHVRFRLLSAALPSAIENIAANTVVKGCPLIIDANANNHGETGSYTPKAVVIAGGARRKALLAKGALFAAGWVGENALEAMGIRAMDGISMEEIMQKVSEALRQKFTKNVTGNPYDGCCSVGGTTPWVRTVYPFDNECVFELRGDNYRQAFKIDMETREVTLDGAPVKVEQEFVDVNASSADLQPFATYSKLPYIPLGVRVEPAMTMPAFFGVSFGAINSELRNPMFGEPFLNVDKVVAAYRDMIKNGMHAPVLPPAAPVPGVRMKFAAELRNRGVVSPADFMAWVDKHKGSPLMAATSTAKSDYAHAPGEDSSNWKLPIHNKNAVQKSMARFDNTDMPDSARKPAANKIVNRAKSMGVDHTAFSKAQGLTIDTDVDAETHEHHAGEFSVGDKAHYNGSMSGRKVPVSIVSKHANETLGRTEYDVKVVGDKHADVGYHAGYSFRAPARKLTPRGKIAAGGPGSGRYPAGSTGNGAGGNYASNEQAKTVASFAKRGYEEQANRGTLISKDGKNIGGKSTDRNAVTLKTPQSDKNPNGRTAIVYSDGGFGHHDESGQYKTGNSSDDAEKLIGDGKSPQHESGSPVKSGPTSVHDEQHADPAKPSGQARGYGDGQKDEYGITHNNAERDRTIAELTKVGFKETDNGPVLKQRDIHSFTKGDNDPAAHSVRVFGDGSYRHTSADSNFAAMGKTADDLKKHIAAGQLSDAGGRTGGHGYRYETRMEMSATRPKHKSFRSRLLGK